MADSGYPKKGEIIHASDVSETFVGVGTSKSISDSWTLHAVNLIRRNDGTVPAIGYVTGSLDESTPGASFVTVGMTKSPLQNLANEHHTHALSDFTELSGWRIRMDAFNTKNLIFGDLYLDKWYLVPDSRFDSTWIRSICYGNGKYVAVGYDGKIAYSADGVNWTLVYDSKFGDSNIQDVCYGNGKFVAGGQRGKMSYSSDGITWTAVSDSKFDRDILRICYENGKFVAVGSDGKMAYSYDGINWTAVADSKFGTSSIYDICYGNGKFVAGGESGKVAYSLDGINWTLDSMFGSSHIWGIYYGNGKFVAVGSSGKIAYAV